MAIVRCPSCSQRVSNLSDTCPECGYSKTDTQIDPETHQRRRLRRLRYQARMMTYLGMLITMVGFLLWWFQNSGFEQLPGTLSSSVIAVGVVGYLVARVWLFWIGSQLKRL